VRRPLSLAIAGLLALVVTAGVLMALPQQQVAVSPTPLATSPSVAIPSPTTAPTASPSPMASGTFEDRIFGYRITLPPGYRRSHATVVTTPGEILGVSNYTVETEQQAREACMRDAGHIPTVREPPDIGVTVYRDTKRASAREWAAASTRSTHHKVEALSVPGYDAARLTQDNVNAATTAVVIRAIERVYEIAWSGAYGGGHHRLLDDVAKTFSAIPPDPFPSPTPTVAPRVAAGETAQALARALAARDADAVARAMPQCWFAVVYAIDGVSPGQGPHNRSVFLFTQALRRHFAAGDLTVTVDPTLQPLAQVGTESYFIRSDWRGADRMRRVDLELHMRDGRAVWAVARHHFTRAEASCISYGSPWTDSTGRC
jgi:hypothetical protein